MLRLSLAPSLVADLTAGLALAQAPLEWWRLACLLPVSLLLFCGGMALNARVDLEQDRRQRPDRPLPSGALDRRLATVLAALGLLGAPAAALALTGAAHVAAGAGVLALLIAGYHTPLRRQPLLGPILLGLVRTGDLLLPVWWADRTLDLSLAGAALPLCYLGFVTGASLVAHQEDRPVGRAWIPAGRCLVALSCLGALTAIGLRPLAGSGGGLWLVAAAALVLKELAPPLLRAPRTSAQVEALAGRLLGRMPLLLVLLCLASGEPWGAAVCLGCFLLVRLLVRWVPPT